MLPFLKPKMQTGLIIQTRKPDGSKQEQSSDEDKSAPLRTCAADLIRAIHAKDEDGVASAIQAAFEILDSMPHEEGEHTNEQE